jgi:hypothetical protein
VYIESRHDLEDVGPYLPHASNAKVIVLETHDALIAGSNCILRFTITNCFIS